MLSAARAARLANVSHKAASRRGYASGPQKNPYEHLRKTLKVGGKDFTYYDLKELKDKRLSTYLNFIRTIRSAVHQAEKQP
jgi:hypothetical protein